MRIWTTTKEHAPFLVSKQMSRTHVTEVIGENDNNLRREANIID